MMSVSAKSRMLMKTFDKDEVDGMEDYEAEFDTRTVLKKYLKVT